ncbi:hypothetical protein L218DRAFT_623873 [Marasmius fiardii PR-910]|nr:hypothetical protein L218DRAFT_623873 [Marasmius fiardii PR-910]
MSDFRALYWNRLQSKYCRRVRKITYRNKQLGDITRLFDVMLRIRSPSAPILPNLKHIVWREVTGGSRELNLFMHEDVIECKIFDEKRCLDLLEEYAGPLLELIRSLPNLRTLLLPSFPDISDVIQFASTPKKLTNLEFPRYLISGRTSGLSVVVVKEAGLYSCVVLPVLERLCTSYATAISFLNKHCFGALHEIDLGTTRTLHRHECSFAHYPRAVPC